MTVEKRRFGKKNVRWPPPPTPRPRHLAGTRRPPHHSSADISATVREELPVWEASKARRRHVATPPSQWRQRIPRTSTVDGRLAVAWRGVAAALANMCIQWISNMARLRVRGRQIHTPHALPRAQPRSLRRFGALPASWRASPPPPPLPNCPSRPLSVRYFCQPTPLQRLYGTPIGSAQWVGGAAHRFGHRNGARRPVDGTPPDGGAWAGGGGRCRYFGSARAAPPPPPARTPPLVGPRTAWRSCSGRSACPVWRGEKIFLATAVRQRMENRASPRRAPPRPPRPRRAQPMICAVPRKPPVGRARGGLRASPSRPPVATGRGAFPHPRRPPGRRARHARQAAKGVGPANGAPPVGAYPRHGHRRRSAWLLATAAVRATPRRPPPRRAFRCAAPPTLTPAARTVGTDVRRPASGT